MTETYQVLADCARRRIGQEWACTEAERAVLSLVNDLSFCLGQSLALVPSLADFAAVTGLHKSTISRAIRSALKKGYLMIVKRRDETLYAVCTDTAGQEAKECGAGREETRKRLVEMNQQRLQGVADGNGQQRLPGIFESEEVESPARAFAAILEQPNDVSSTAELREPTRIPTPTRFEDKLAQLERTFEAATSGESLRTSGKKNRPASLEQQWQEASRGLKADALYALELVRDECAAAGPREEAAFYQWRFTWRKRAARHTLKTAEAAGVCKAMRLEGSTIKEPGAFIYRSMQAANAIDDS